MINAKINQIGYIYCQLSINIDHMICIYLIQMLSTKIVYRKEAKLKIQKLSKNMLRFFLQFGVCWPHNVLFYELDMEK